MQPHAPGWQPSAFSHQPQAAPACVGLTSSGAEPPQRRSGRHHLPAAAGGPAASGWWPRHPPAWRQLSGPPPLPPAQPPWQAARQTPASQAGRAAVSAGRAALDGAPGGADLRVTSPRGSPGYWASERHCPCWALACAPAQARLKLDVLVHDAEDDQLPRGLQEVREQVVRGAAQADGQAALAQRAGGARRADGLGRRDAGQVLQLLQAGRRAVQGSRARGEGCLRPALATGMAAGRTTSACACRVYRHRRTASTRPAQPGRQVSVRTPLPPATHAGGERTCIRSVEPPTAASRKRWRCAPMSACASVWAPMATRLRYECAKAGKRTRDSSACAGGAQEARSRMRAHA